MSFLMEQAGGQSFTGKQRVLTLLPFCLIRKFSVPNCFAFAKKLEAYLLTASKWSYITLDYV